MAALKLSFNDDGLSHGSRPEHYSDSKAFEILQRYLQPNSDLLVEKAASNIAEMLPAETEFKTRFGEVGMFGGLVYEIAQQIPHNHPSQVKLVRLLQRLARSAKLNTVEIDEVRFRHLQDFELEKLTVCVPRAMRLILVWGS